MADGSVKILAALDNTGIEKGVKEMNSKVASGAKKAASALKSGLKFSAGAVTAVAGGVGALVVKGMKYNATIEQLQTSFKVMLGSASKAKQMISNMTSFAAKTPFQTTDLAQAGKTLMGYGVAAKDVMGTLKMLGDVSQGNAEKMKGLALVYGQIMANGKLQGQDLLQLISNGFNPLQIISKKTGKSMSELREEMSKGKISAQEVADAFKTATSKGGQFYNDMEEQSKTFNGQISTLKDNTSMFLGDLTKGLSDAAKNTALPKINEYMEDLNKSLKSGGLEGVNKEIGSIAADAVNQIAKAAPDVVKEATNLITAFNNGITDNAGEISKSAVKIGEELVKGLEKIVPSAGKAAGALIKGIVTQIAGSDAGNAVQSTIDSIGKAFESLKGPAQSAVKSISEIIGNLATTVSRVAQTVLPALSSALGFVAEHFQQIVPAVLGAVAAFKSFEAIKSAATAVKKFSDAMVTASKAESVASKAFTAISNGAEALTGPVGLAIAAIAGITAAIVLWEATSDNFKKKHEETMKALDEDQKELDEESKSWIEATQETQKGVDAVDGESGKLKSLATQLNKLVDAHGNIKRGEEEHVDTILNQLNPALGIELKRNGDVISGYDTESKSIQKLIEKKQALAELDAHQDQYNKAKSSLSSTTSSLAEKQGAINDKKSEISNIVNTGNPESINIEKLADKIEELQKLRSQYQQTAADAKKYSDTVAKYDDANAKISSGNYAGAITELKNLSSAYSAAGGATTQQLQKQAEAYGKAYQGLRARQEAGDKNVTQEQVNAARTLAENAGAEYEKAGGKAGDKYVEGFKNSGIKMSAKEIQSEFKQFGYSLPDAAAKAFASKAPSVQTAAMQCLNSIQSGVQATEPQISAAFTALGVSLPEPIIKSFAAATPETQAMIAYFFQNISSGVKLKSGELQALFSEMGVQLPRGLLDSLSQQSPAAQKAAAELVGALESGISPGKAKLASMFSAMGTDATNSLLSALSHLVPGGVTAINSMLSSMGVALNANGELVYLGGKKAGQLVKSMSDITGKATLKGPKAGTVNGSAAKAKESTNTQSAHTGKTTLAGSHAGTVKDSSAKANQSTNEESAHTGSTTLKGAHAGKIQGVIAAVQSAFSAASSWLSSHSLIMWIDQKTRQNSSTRTVDDDLRQHSANGRIVDHKMISELGEEGYPEAVIPINPSRRTRALHLWEKTGEMLGISPIQKHANGGIVGNLNNALPSNPKIVVTAQIISNIQRYASHDTSNDKDPSEKLLEQAEKYVDDMKQYDELSTEQETAFWEKIRKLHTANGKALNDIDHKIYEAKKANSQAIVSDAESYLSHYKAIGKMTDDWELSYWQRTLNREGLFAEQKKAIEEKIYAAQKQYSQDLVSDLEKEIQHSETMHEISTDDELHYWQNLLKNRNLMADELDTVNEKIYEAEQKLKDEDKQRSEDEYSYFETAIQDDVTFNNLDVQGQLNSWKSVYDDYEHGLIYMQDAEAKKVRVNIANLQKQIKEQQDDAVKEQQDNLKSRIDSLKSWSGLFDEPSYNWEVSPDELMWNMKEQVRMMQNWQSDMATLQARGISSAMLKQLQDLGPAAADKIHALTEMTSSELQKYQALFNTKNNIATNEGTKELGIPSSASVSVSLNVDNNSVAAVNNTVQTVVDTTEQAAAAIPVAVTNAVTEGMNNLESTVKDRMPAIIKLFKDSGTDAGNAYGTNFVDRIKDSMNTFSSTVKSATDSAQTQLSTTLKAASDTNTAIDSLTQKVSNLELNAVYPNFTMQADGRQIAKVAGPYMGAVLKYKR